MLNLINVITGTQGAGITAGSATSGATTGGAGTTTGSAATVVSAANTIAQTLTQIGINVLA